MIRKFLSRIFGRKRGYAASTYSSSLPVVGGYHRPQTDDDVSLSGSAVVDGLLGVPSSPTALFVDVATHPADISTSIDAPPGVDVGSIIGGSSGGDSGW